MYLLRELSPGFPEALAVSWRIAGAPGPVWAAPPGQGVPPLSTLRACCPPWASAVHEPRGPSLAGEHGPDPSSGEGQEEAVPPPEGSPSCSLSGQKGPRECLGCRKDASHTGLHWAQQAGSGLARTQPEGGLWVPFVHSGF